MSYTTIMIREDDTLHSASTLKNSHGSAPYVWEEFGKAYMKGFTGYLWFDSDQWSLWRDNSIPVKHRSVFMMTFDKVWVKSENFLRAANDIEAFLIDFPPNPSHVNHWKEIAAFFRECEQQGIYIWQTSITDPPISDGWDEELQTYAIDWREATELYELLEKVGAVTQEHTAYVTQPQGESDET